MHASLPSMRRHGVTGNSVGWHDIIRPELMLGLQLALPLGDHGGRQRVADHVGGAASHIEERIDGEVISLAMSFPKEVSLSA